MQRLVIADYVRVYDDPVVGRAGDAVLVGQRDDDAPGWVWCVHAETGREGWVAEAFLAFADDRSRASLRRDYSAMELSVAAGETVVALEAVAGWIWCRNASGDAGWVPDGKLEAAI